MHGLSSHDVSVVVKAQTISLAVYSWIGRRSVGNQQEGHFQSNMVVLDLTRLTNKRWLQSGSTRPS